MKDLQWDRVQELFLATVDLPPDRRAHILDTACAGDPAMRQEVESLVDSDHRETATISDAVEAEAAQLFDFQNIAGERLGAYRVVREIGRGGMGAVYLATRDDEQYSKSVAIKIVKRGMDTAEVLERFRYERQILANLDHPYIARLIDGGTTPDGRPFFVMDYVAGQPVDVFCREHVLDVKARCKLFLNILEAVSYAHRNLVVHRDLKPGNVFVTADGTPRLLDFGVAKLVTGDALLQRTTSTMTRPFTPEYASPEQVRGLPVTTSSDVYSAGAVLYELLTGQLAQPVAAHTAIEIERAVCETEVLRPSLIARTLDTDLDNIVLMAMRKDPGRRYASIDQFAEDIRRYLEGLPVVARQDSFAYRAGKFLRRNRLQIAAAALVFLSLLTGLLVSLAQSRRAEAHRIIAVQESSRAEAESRRAEAARESEAQQRGIADRERDEADRQRALADRRVTDLIGLANRTLFEVHDGIALLPGAVPARQQIVKTTLEYLERLEKDTGLDDRMRLVLSAAYARVGRIQGDPYSPSLGDFEGSRVSFQKGKAILAPLYQRKGNDPEVLTRWIEIESGIAEATYRLGQDRAAERAFEALLLPAQHLTQLRPQDVDPVKQEAELHQRLAIIFQGTDPNRGLDHANRQIELLKGLISRFPDHADLKQDLGTGFSAAAGILRSRGDIEQSAQYYQQSIRMREELFQADPNNVTLRRSLLVVYGNYASVLGIPWSPNLGRFDEARTYCTKGVALARDLVKRDPEDSTARYDLAISLSRLGMVDPGPEGEAASLSNLQEAIGMIEPILKANPTSVSVGIQLALAREYAGHRLEKLGETAAAEQQYRESLALMTAMQHSQNTSVMVQTITDEEALALLYASTHDRTNAVEFAARALADAETNLAMDRTSDLRIGHLARAHFVRASVERSFGNWDQAQQAAERAMALWRPIHNSGVLSLHQAAIADAEAMLHEIAGRRGQK